MNRRHGWPAWFVVVLVLVAGRPSWASSPAALAWSPDGEWISYVVETPAKPIPPRTGWIFDPRDESGAKLAGWDAGRSRLWASKVGTATSVLLDESAGAITPPGWSPDGRGLAFGRVTLIEGDRRRFEVVCIEGSSRRVLLSQTFDDWGRATDRLASSAVAWSPDGRFLAVPQFRPAGLAILRAETGRLVKSIEHASFPAWSHDGARLYYISSGDQDQLECLESHFGASRHLSGVGQVDGPPIVSRDGLSAVVLSRVRVEGRGAAFAERVELVRVRAEDGRKEVITGLLGVSGQGMERVLNGTALAVDRDGENMLSTLAITGQPSQVSWYRPRERQVYKKFPVLDTMLTLSDLALSPSGGVIALRIGDAGSRGLPLLCDLDSMQLTPLAPDEPTRSAWVARLMATAAAVIQENRPRPIIGGRAIDRPVALPIPGELDPNSEPVQRLRRIGRAGRPLCDAPASSKAWDEVRFLFDYLRESYPAALAGVDALDARGGTEAERLQLLTLRAQVFAGMGDFDRARGTLGYLRAIEPSRTSRVVESTSRGPVFSESPPTDAGWPAYAINRVEALEKAAAKEEEAASNPADEHRNPDAPTPGLGLDAPPVQEMPPLPRPAPPVNPPRVPMIPGPR